MSGSVVVVGSLHHDIMIHAPDRPRRGETVTGQSWHPKFGGKGGNQAVAAAQAGAETRFVGAVGQDSFAEPMLAGLSAHGIATDRVARIRERGTGMSVAIIDAEGDYGAVIVSGANLAIDPDQFADTALWHGARVLILQNEVPEAVNIAAAQMARRHGVKVCLNAAPARPLPTALAACIDILVVNAVEAEDLSGKAVPDRPAALRAAETLSAQVDTVIVTCGGEGVAWAVRGQAAGTHPAPQVEVVSTHGAGDVFVGVLAHRLCGASDLETAIEAATAAASRHVSAR